MSVRFVKEFRVLDWSTERKVQSPLIGCSMEIKRALDHLPATYRVTEIAMVPVYESQEADRPVGFTVRLMITGSSLVYWLMALGHKVRSWRKKEWKIADSKS